MALDVLQRYSAGIELLKEFEGCRLKAYRCPAGVWTIGWGSTTRANGAAVKAGDQISQAEADSMLATVLGEQVVPALAKIPHWDEMSAEQQGALISFAWNLGWDFYGAEGFATISGALRNKAWDKVPAALALYCNPGSSFEAGLRRRREAEGKLWAQGMTAPAAPETPKAAPAKGSAQSKPLFRITALQDTWLKKKPVQASELGEKEKVAVAKGKGYAVLAYEECAANAHAQVTLAANSGTWFVFAPHWDHNQATGEAMPAAVDWSDFNCLVTPNLTVGEILQWDTRRIPAEGASVRARLLQTAAAFQQVRDAWGAPLGVTSFYRPEPINTEVGGVPNSKHITGEAMDIYPVNGSLEAFYQWIRQRWTGGLGDGRNKGFIHCDLGDGTGGFVPGAGVRPNREWVY